MDSWGKYRTNNCSKPKYRSTFFRDHLTAEDIAIKESLVYLSSCVNTFFFSNQLNEYIYKSKNYTILVFIYSSICCEIIFAIKRKTRKANFSFSLWLQKLI